MNDIFDLLGRSAEIGSALLVVATQDDTAQRLAAQLEFLELNVILVAPEGVEAAVRSAGGGLLGLVVPGSIGASLLSDVVRRATDAKADLPLVLFDDGDADQGGLAKRFLAVLRPPVRYSRLAELVRELRVLQAQAGLPSAERPEIFRSLVGRSPAIQAVRRMVMRVAPWEVTVQLRGETGTGKEVVARNIHYYSTRRHGPFVAVNCGAIPPDLLESELFGHEKGAFTGALTARKGRFELASGGTLFLDEIGDMPLEMQVKLLRVLQERRFEPLGSTRTVTADVRIVAATHRNLEEMIGAGRFREDLYYRLNVVPIEVPPLRERREDLPLLISELNARLQARGMPTARFDAQALTAMLRYDWPGNVRELANLVERCAILAPDREVRVSDLPEKLRVLVPQGEQDGEPATTQALLEGLGSVGLPVEQGMNLKNVLDNIEVRLIRQALESSEGVVARAAKLLGLRRTTLVEKMRKFQIGRLDEVTEF
ncbi:MAG TPA: sigma-54 dependent transcriptional regulator [Gammaproteobacteria bacterium]